MLLITSETWFIVGTLKNWVSKPRYKDVIKTVHRNP